MSFARRRIALTFKLGKGQFGDSGSQEVRVTGLRTKVQIVKGGGPGMSSANVQVFGLTLAKMNQLSTLGMIPTLVRKNTLTIEAGDDSANAMGVIFQGTIFNAYADMNASPEVAFMIECQAGLLEAVQTAKPTSIRGSSDVATMIQGMATQMNLVFENNGVNAKLSNAYYTGSPRTQAFAMANDAGINIVIDNGRLAIWPADGTRRGQIPTISKATGMKGYPTFTSRGIAVEAEFQPSFTFGSKVKVENAILKPADGEWVIYKLVYNLASETPNGDWFCSMEAARPGFVVV